MGYREGERTGKEDGSVGKNEETEIGRSGRRIQDQEGTRLGVLEERQGWGVGPLVNKIWFQQESLAGSALQPCGYEDLNRILRPQVTGVSDTAQEDSVQSGRRSRACVHFHIHAGEVRVK